MFANFIISLAILYLITSAMVIFFIYFLHQIIGIENWSILAILGLILSGFISAILARVSIKPLIDHLKNLEDFSKETLHELNLPIATIKTNIALLEKNITNPKDIKRLMRILKASDMLQSRYNELDYLIKKQSFKEEIMECDISSIINERVEFFREIFTNIKWDIELDTLIYRCDPIGFAKVIDNILQNSVKYSPNNPIITIKQNAKSVSICDNGIGMDEITLIHIFERYFQNDIMVNGFGIGLSMVRHYCDKHNIILDIDSQKGMGTCIKLVFKG